MDILPPSGGHFWHKERLETFKNWPFKSSNSSCNPETMASAGFIAVGGADEPDLAECFICGKQLDGWEETDDPWLEHASHQPRCPYIMLNKQNEQVWTLEELLRLLKQHLIRQVTRKKTIEITKFKEEVSQLAKDIPNQFENIRRSKKL